MYECLVSYKVKINIAKIKLFQAISVHAMFYKVAQWHLRLCMKIHHNMHTEHTLYTETT